MAGIIGKAWESICQKVMCGDDKLAAPFFPHFMRFYWSLQPRFGKHVPSFEYFSIIE